MEQGAYTDAIKLILFRSFEQNTGNKTGTLLYDGKYFRYFSQLFSLCKRTSMTFNDYFLLTPYFYNMVPKLRACDFGQIWSDYYK
jgi:hypothetical protein